MDFGKALNSECHGFDLNIPYLEEEDLNSNAENQFSSSPLIQNSTQDMNITTATANNGNINIEEAHNPAAFDVVHPTRMYVDSLHVPGYRGVTMGSRRRYRRRGQVQPTDPLRYCTNYHCKTRKTPLWRKGPLGPKTLCNACGISYMKQVRRGVPGDSSASSSGSASVPPATTATVVEGTSPN